MYMLYIDHVLFPVAPGRIETQAENDNRVIKLIDGSEVNLIGTVGLKKISFDLLLPEREYPFAMYESGFKEAEYYVELIDKIFKENKSVELDIYRTNQSLDKTYLTSMTVLPCHVSFIEDADNGSDIIARLEFREYRKVETRIAEEKKRTYTRIDTYTVPDTYTVKKNDSLWRISKLIFEDGTKYTYLAEINGIKKPYVIYPGQVIKLRE